MPLPVIAHVYRVTFNWNRFGGVRPRNVIHVLDNTGGSNEGAVGAAIGSLLGSIGHQFDVMPIPYQLGEIDVIKLDGTSAGVTVPFSATDGGGSSDFTPQAAAIVSLRTALRGQAHRGRMFLGPVSENEQAQGIVEPTTQALMQTAWDTFAADLVSSSPSLTWVIASYKHSTAQAVTSLRVESNIGTMRRRNQQLRR